MLWRCIRPGDVLLRRYNNVAASAKVDERWTSNELEPSLERLARLQPGNGCDGGSASACSALSASESKSSW